VIFCGDWNHVRSSTENNVLNVSYNLMQKLSSAAKVYCILGNHDLYLKNSTELTSLVIFKDLANVKLICQPYEISINGNRTLLVPWLSDVSGF
jgi:predicted MPP superfamily phosphohydrolase